MEYYALRLAGSDCILCHTDPYDDRNIKVATSLIHILSRAGLDFGVLGNSEWCWHCPLGRRISLRYP
jgi:hypothetical protein